MKVQLKDIAKEANVSVALVSYVMNGLHTNRIKKETAANIRAIAKRLNYQPNHFAKGLKTKKSNTIGLILADFGNSFSTQILRTIEGAAAAQGYTVLIGTTDEDNEKLQNLIDTFMKQQVDGLIILPTENGQKQIENLHKDKMPYVLIDRYFSDTPFDFIANDNHFSTYEATKQLINTGKKKIGFITIATTFLHFSERKKGFVSACTAANINHAGMVKELLGYDNLKDSVSNAIDELRATHSDLDGLLFSTDILTMYGLRYAIKHQLNIPETIEFMGFDEAKFYNIFPTPISYYKQPLDAIGEKAVAYVLAKIKGDAVDGIQEIIKGEVVVKNKTNFKNLTT